jgi:aspartyl-tRNA(Asn)/glutamyl-tRNA(Gln) amidotransferase subunit A
MHSIMELRKAYRDRKLSPVEVISSLLAKIEASPVNAYITVMAEDAMQRAVQAERDIMAGKALGPLHGVPVAVKDLVHVAGTRTTMGSKQYAEFVSTRDAAIIPLLRNAGAIIVGKTNTHEFAYGPTGDRSHFGAVRNPRDLNRMPGGSSSGSAAAVGAGLAYGAIGSDTSASIRLPASLCGVVGMKATKGLVSKEGVFPLSETLDHVGPITSTVRDNGLMLAVLSGKDESHYLQQVGKGVRGKVVGLPDRFYCEYLSSDVRQAVDAAAAMLADAGATVKTVSLAGIEKVYAAQQLILKTEAYALHEPAISAGAPYDDEVRERLLTGKDIRAAEYIQAMAMRIEAEDVFAKALSEVDFLLTPTSGITAPLLEERTTSLNGEEHPTRWLLTRLTAPTNFSGNPSLSVPFGADRNKMPIGLQLIGKMHDEAVLYQAAEFLGMQ